MIFIIQCFTQKLFIFYVNFIQHNHLIMFLNKINMFFYTWKLSFVLLLSHFLGIISTANIEKVVSMLFSQRWSNADEHALTQLSFWTKYQRWKNIESSTLNRRNYFNVDSRLFCQRWNNVDKNTSTELSFSIKFQLWNNIASSTTLNRRNSIDVVSMLFANVETMSINVHWLNFHLQPNINVETTLMKVDWENFSSSNIHVMLKCF